VHFIFLEQLSLHDSIDMWKYSFLHLQYRGFNFNRYAAHRRIISVGQSLYSLSISIVLGIINSIRLNP